jgi:hypothetical protein
MSGVVLPPPGAQLAAAIVRCDYATLYMLSVTSWRSLHRGVGTIRTSLKMHLFEAQRQHMSALAAAKNSSVLYAAAISSSGWLVSLYATIYQIGLSTLLATFHFK